PSGAGARAAVAHAARPARDEAQSRGHRPVRLPFRGFHAGRLRPAPGDQGPGGGMSAAAPRVSLIAAMARNRVIGAGGKIPWRLPGELALFKRITMGHTIIMGRATWESIGRLLHGRSTVIVSRQPGYAVPGARVAHSLDDAVADAHG